MFVVRWWKKKVWKKKWYKFIPETVKIFSILKNASLLYTGIEADWKTDPKYYVPMFKINDSFLFKGLLPFLSMGEIYNVAVFLYLCIVQFVQAFFIDVVLAKKKMGLC